MRQHAPREPVAIIGVGLRLPGADNLDGFWYHLAAGNSLIRQVPESRWSAADFLGDPGKGNKTASVWGGFVEDADCFDAAFFGISPREAAWMDPQQRFALEMAWHAIEDAGYRASDLAGSRTGVYMGVCHWDYAELLEKHLATVDAYTPTGIAFSIIANRVSHFLDLQGPSVTNDTACAASMTSVYDAVRAIQDGTCGMALAGGVNLIWSPNHFVAFSKAGMLSRDGRSKAFDEAADGYVRGEGGAVLLLKPLAKALADQDPIHAVIRGIGINHGGRTNSLTVTNPAAQAALIRQVHDEAGVSPDTISYVEAHGPGTPLGDPIEISGLKQAFGALAEEHGVNFTPATCGIGSVKTNIGHLEGAAGVAGIVKVIAALKHGSLPPNVGFKEPNRLIDLEGTPFSIQRELTDWPSGGAKPRRACVSSFGFGGSNGHVLLEEAPEAAAGASRSRRALHPVPISAADHQRLHDYVTELLGFVERADAGELPLSDLAFTFQTGREALEARCVFLARDLTDLAASLRDYLAHEGEPVSLWPEDIAETVPASSGKLVALARKWVTGEETDWSISSKKGAAKRIHVPVYPFERQRHWMDLSLGAKDQERVPHPLLHRNTSGFDHCSFETRFTGDEFVLADHLVDGKKVLPGVAGLEMVRAASRLVGAFDEGAVAFEDLLWRRPVVLAGATSVTIETRLQRPLDGRLGFSLTSKAYRANSTDAGEDAQTDSGQPNVTGLISVLDETGDGPADLEDLKRKISTPVDISTCYDWLRSSGVNHGPAFRALTKVFRAGDEVLAELRLPRRLLPSLEAMDLHPAMLDAAIQAWVAVNDRAPAGATVPFSCRRIEIYGSCEPVMWAHVRLTSGAAEDSPVRKLDIDLLDKSGAPAVIFRDLALRVLKAKDHDPVDADRGTLVISEGQWHAAPLHLQAHQQTTRAHVFIAGGSQETAEALADKTGWTVQRLPDVAGLGEAEAAEIVFSAASGLVRELLRARVSEQTTVLALATDTVPAPVIAPLAGLLRTAAIENPKISGRVVSLAGDARPDRLRAVAAAELEAYDAYTELRYDREGARQAWGPTADPSGGVRSTLEIDPDGVYWITGGLGGLGRQFSEWLVKKGARKLVLTGRNETLEPKAADWLAGLCDGAVEVVYWPCDIANQRAVERLTARIASDLGPLKGIIHAAGVLSDGYILTQAPADVALVFAPKVAGTVNLDRATRNLPLDFLVLCSSIASVFGNAGQAVYAAANGFMDAFAEQRQRKVKAGRRAGRTLAVAWPLWADGGMTVDKATLEAMRRRLGLTPLPAADGLAALETLLTSGGSPRATVMHGDTGRIEQVLSEFGVASFTEAERAQEAAPLKNPVNSDLDRGELVRRTIDFVRDVLGDVLEMDPSRIRPNRKLEEYGLDSIAIVESTSRLEEALGSLSKTLFFEYVDLQGVAEYLAVDHEEALRTLFAEERAPAPADDTGQKAVAAHVSSDDVVASGRVPDEQNAVRSGGSEDDRHDIAIVGLSLHVSNADTQDAFWKMLSEGIDGFEPVPAERWDNGALHHGERDILGKTVVKTGAFLPDIDKFDPRYFRISQAEAELMSPEVRLFLLASVEAFEDAGYSRETMARRFGGDVAVIMGSMTNEYDLYGFQNMLMRGSFASGSYTGTVPNMVSYYYGFTGPSYFLDTMCSASSTCVHEAVHMLRAGRCQMALAGGVSLLLHPQKLIATSQEHFTTKSADVIRGYGLGAEGTILGEGVGALVLKTLADAERDGDHIYGVIKGTGVSNAGTRNGFTVPNPNQQAVAIEKALQDAGFGADTIGYIEGHGSGTALGDPIEVKALTKVFRKHTAAVQTCPIGTVKSNVAHLLGASGLAGIVKVLAQLKHGQLAPSLHAETLNPDIPFETSPFYVQRELTNWQRLRDANGAELPRRAGVTSIGAGGMNSHIIIEEYQAPARTSVQDEPELLVFSALTPDRLRAVLERFVDFLRGARQEHLADIAYTLQVGKTELTSRLALVVQDREAALSRLEAFLADGKLSPDMVHVASILDIDPPEDKDALKADCAARRLERIGDAWARGAAIDWDLVNKGRDVRRISLPAYPFEKIRCWYAEEPDAPSVINPLGSRSKLHPFIGENQSDVTGLRYTTGVHLKELRDYIYLEGGRETILPTVAPEIVAAVARTSGVAANPRVSNLQFETNPPWSDVKDLEIGVEPGDGTSAVRVQFVTASGERSAWFRADVSDLKEDRTHAVDLETLQRQASEVLDQKALYAELKRRRLSFGPYLESIGQLWRLDDGTLLCALRADQPQQDFFKKNVFCPAPALGAAYEALVVSSQQFEGAVLSAIESASFSGDGIAYVLMRADRGGRTSIEFLDEDGHGVGTLAGVALGDQVAVLSQMHEAVPLQQEKPAELLQQDLRAKASAILKFDAADLSARDAFHDLGFDSISLTRYANEISAAFGIDLSPAIFFECEHIEALADHLINRHGVVLSQLTKEQAPVRAMAALSAEDVVGSETIPAPAVVSHPAVKPYVADDRVAIIGMSGRFPGAADVEAFFDQLLTGRDLTSDMPMGRYSPAYADRLRKAGFARHGGFLDDVDRFDAAFFKVSPVEAERMDPQQRLLLECAWRTLENAGYAPEDLPRKTGVFIGITSLDYAQLWRAEGLTTDGYVATGNSLAMAANRLSHQFNLKGPSQAIDTACSSSLIALLRARDALKTSQASAAIVGGVNLCLSLEGFEGPHQAGMLSPTGHCSTFGARADGYARGEGVATLLLKPLADAERAGDRILGVIAGGAENHGGRSGALTSPNAKAQAQLIVDAMRGIDPATVSYIEAHGTGTELGDPVEINGLRRAYSELRGSEEGAGPQIGLGTVKSNIGHLEAAAGIAGVVKVLMAMRRQVLPPTLNSAPVNPHIDLKDSPFRIVTACEAWPAGDFPRRAGVSSFGFGGANAHVVLESYDKPSGRSRQPLPQRKFASTRFWLPEVTPSGGDRDRMLFGFDWAAAEAQGKPFDGRRIVVGCGVPIASVQNAETHTLQPAGDGIAGRYRDAARQLLELLRKEMASTRHEPVLVQLVVPASGEGNLFSGLGGMLQTATQEEPRIRTQVIEVQDGSGSAQVAALLATESSSASASHIRYVGGRRHVRVWRELPDAGPAHRWRDGGVYLIAGGMGGLGRLLAEDIARTAKGVVLVLTGSKPLDDERAEFLTVLRSLGAVTAYRQVDLASREAVKAVVDHIIEVHGALNGVFHAAGVLRDGFIAQKSSPDVQTVLAPKVDGALALREACAALDLDAFVLFSSLAGPFGNAGQADYAAANGFLEALARSSGGRITAVDWPLWRDGGMRVDDVGREALFRRMGQRPIEADAGLRALRQCLEAEVSQVAVVAGDEDRIRSFFADEEPPVVRQPAVAPAVSDGVPAAMPSPGLAARTREKLTELFAKVSGLSAASIDPQMPLEDYGIDSLMITKLNNALDGIFAALPKTLFFRYRTLAAVSGYLVETQPDACSVWTGGLADKAIRSATGQEEPKTTPSAVAAPVPAAEPIAIIGMSGSYPDASDLEAFWENLLAGHDAVREIPTDRWPLDGFFEADPDTAVSDGKSYSKWGAFLDGFAEFDPLFFKLSPRDAAAMDPQERLFLMSAWQAVEDAGYTRDRLKQVAGCDHGGARVGVFAGVTKTGFALHGPFRTEGGATVRPATSFASIANRVSHVFDLSGPSLPVDTMCSSSLTAIHEACEHLRSGSCAMAIAGGVNLYLHPSSYVELCAAHMLSPSGQCRSFGEGADGFVPGEGVGCVLLKPLSKALADGDRIHALIRGSAVNHGGRTNGYTVPNPHAQKDVVRAALDKAGLNAQAISYIEAHGTGTDLGDPIEVDGLAQAFVAGTAATGFCALGSVKSNIGHLEAAAGIAGLSKVVLQMKRGTLVPSLHSERLNPNIDLANSPFTLQQESAPWVSTGLRRAGVSSFGAGGANAHIILEEWSDPGTGHHGEQAGGSPEIVILSARDNERLKEAAERLLSFVRKTEPRPDEGSPDPQRVLDAIRGQLGRLLDVDPRDIDPEETFDSLGLDASHLPVLQTWCQRSFGVLPTPSDLDVAESVAGLSAFVSAVGTKASVSDAAVSLSDIAFTLQIGREPMECRLALVAKDVDQLAAALEKWVSGDEPSVPMATSEAHGQRGVLASLADDEVLQEVVSRAWQTGRLETVMRLWVEGIDIDWAALRGDAPGRIVSLPTYPFEKTRYWIPQPATVHGGDGLHPVSRGDERSVRSLIEARSGDAELTSELEVLETAVARVLQALLKDISEADVISTYWPWLEAARTLLSREFQDDRSSPGEAWSAWEALKRQGISPAQMTLAEAALRALPEILTGTCRATDVLFPDGRQSLVEAVYKENRIAARFSRTVAEAAARFAEDWKEPSRKLRILEIGAGTGGTSEPVFEALRPFADRIGEYAYTDVSRAFLIHAERSFSSRVPGLKTLLFDIEKPLCDQNIEGGRYDLVIAANVLHATADIHATLARVRETMAPGGVLLLNETSKPTFFTHVTFGLLEGWWRFTDPERRIPGTPSLTGGNWRDALSANGLDWVAGSSTAEQALGQQIIAARSDAAISAKTDQADPEKSALNVASGIRDRILSALGETLNMAPESIALDRSFADYGLDSILGAEFVHRLRKALEIALDQTALFDFTNVSKLEAHLRASYPHLVERASVIAGAGADEVLKSRVVETPAEPISPMHEKRGAPIAIVGASGRFAKSDTIDQLWQHLKAGRDLVEPVSRFDLSGFYPGAEPGSYGKHGSFLDGVDRFDPVFFGISGVEATFMDPQQRLFLEEAWKTLENAGHAGEDMIGRRCGVFVGCAHGDYQELFTEQPPGQAFWGNTTSLIPARISYWLDLKGPAIAIDTACSSSLVALHVACQSIRNGECDMALAGGVFVQSSPRFFRYANAAQMLSPSGRCAAFGAGADGIVPGEAVGAVLLRPLSDALDDGDTILGVVIASGTNQDGTTNGITAPSAASQERLIRQVYEDNGVDPASIDYIEAHGTGTVLGDPIEHAALVRAFAGVEGHSVYLGSVKSNIGHATTAAGIAGLAKVLASLREKTIPATLHFGGGNPAIDFEKGPFRVNTDAVSWPARPDQRRRAAISSFGFSGTNAHVVIEEAPCSAAEREPATSQLFLLSARTAEQLRTQAENLAEHLEAHPDLLPEDVSFTLILGRRAFAHRLALVADDLASFVKALRSWLQGEAVSDVEVGEAPGDQGSVSVSLAAAADLDGERRSEELKTIGRRFLSGARIDVTDLFAKPRRRVPLPTYPFSGKSYWVPSAKPVNEQQPSGTNEDAARARAVESEGQIRLAAPAIMAASIAAAAKVRSEKVRLPQLKPSPRNQVSTGEVRRGKDRDGVRILEPVGSWGHALASAFTKELAAASQDETVSAVLVMCSEAWISQANAVTGFDPDSVLTCQVPVIFSVHCEMTGQPGQMVMLGDFIVAGCPVPFTDLPVSASSLVKHLADRRQSGEQGILRVLPGEADDRALALAREIAQGPREALCLLKRHMRRDLPTLLADLPRAANALECPTGEASYRGTPRAVRLTTDVIRLQIHDDGVVLLTMDERDGRNMFTPAFMDGLEEAFAKIPELPDAKVVVLTGHDSYFACGGTRDGLADLQKGGSRFTDRRIYSLPLECELPVIAAMQGHGIGAGWSLGLYCDHAIHAAEGIYHSNYLWYGFTPGAGATLIFPHRLGDDLGREVLFTARQYRGRDLAERSSRITVLPGRDVLSSALAAAHVLARRTRDKLVSSKNESVRLVRARLDAVLERELEMHEKTFIGNDEVRARIAEKFGEADLVPAGVETDAHTPVDSGALQAELVRSLAEDLMISVDEIRADDSFLDLGLDSILAVTWIRNLNKRFEIDLPATAIYAHPTVAALTARVAELVGAKERSGGIQSGAAASRPDQDQRVEPSETIKIPVAGLRAEIIASLAENLMLDAADITDGLGFLDLGLDSILAVTWIRILNKRYDISLPATAVYAYPTVGSLIAHIGSLGPAVEGDGDEVAPHAAMVAEPEPVRTAQTMSASGPFVATPVISETAKEAIAIIGASGKFPKATNLETFWRNIADGRDCIGEVPASRWDIDRYFDPDPQAPGKTYCKWMGALDDVDAFDARFFNILPREAELMDPQQRLFLETAWHTIENAGLNPHSLAGKRCGVFVSSGPSGYEDQIEERNTYSLLGSSGSILAARISYLLDLRGPSISIDTACSSSLVAIAQACEALLSGTCDMALAGGACVLVGPNMFIDTAKVSMLSPDGHCYSFDERANGFVPGEGVGAILLKRLSDAERDGDPIHAVIRGWGTNQDGRTNGITAPNPKAQTALMKDVYERFDIDPATIGLVECHGTGTPLGDPIEVEGLTDAFQGAMSEKTCAIGSVKSNIGHLLASAGIAGALKAMLALEARQIPPSINLETLNSHIPFERTPFVVSRSLTDWEPPVSGTPRRAAVSSFGFSGTNAHLVLEEHAAVTSAGPASPAVFVLSAHTRDRLLDYAAEMERFVIANQRLDLMALASTIQTGRPGFSERLAFVFSDRNELLRKLASVTSGARLEGVYLSVSDEASVSLFTSDDDAQALIRKWLRSGDMRQLDKVAELWAKGVDIDWPKLTDRRVHVPGYPFARSRYWVEASQMSSPVGSKTEAAEAAALLGMSPAEGEVGRITIRINGDEPFLTTHLNGEKRLVTGLFLPEVARGALERLSGKPVSGLKHLIWGKPVSVNGKPRQFTVTVLSDGEGLLYRVEADGEDQRPCHLGSDAGEPERREPSRKLAIGEALPGTAITETYRQFAERCSVHSGPPTPEMARITEVSQDGDTLMARVSLSRGTLAEGSGMVFDPYVLDPVWRLLAFCNGDSVADAGAGNALGFPSSVETMTGFATMTNEMLVRLVRRSGPSASASFNVELYNENGVEAMRLQGVKLSALESSRDIRLEEDLDR